MTEQIYIDGALLELDRSRVNVQLIYQSPVLVDFQQIVSNRTTQVTLPRTSRNMAAIGYTGTQAVSDYAYRRHKVVYKRDGVQLLRGIATLLAIKADGIAMCFTWGNVEALAQLFETGLRDLGADGEQYCILPPNNALNPDNVIQVDYGGGRRGVGVKVSQLLTKIEQKCGVSGLTDLCYADQARTLEYMLALTTRNGDTRTRELQGVSLGYPMALVTWEATAGNWFTTLKVQGGSDPHGWMDGYGIVDVTGDEKVRVHMEGTILFQQATATPYAPVALRLMFNTGTGWFIGNSIVIAEAESQGANQYSITADYDETLDVTRWEAICLCVMYDSLNLPATIIDNPMAANDIILNPEQGDEVLYGIGALNTYPIYANLPDITCGQFVKNLLWLHGAFAYSKDGRQVQFLSFNDIAQNKAQAVDWTKKVSGKVSEMQFRLDGTGQHNIFRYAEADYYDNTQYQGVLVTDDETIEKEKEYCRCDMAIAPRNVIPAWKTTDGEWDYTEYPCVIIVSSGQRLGKYYTMQDWDNILNTYYGEYAEMIRRPVVVKANVVLTTYDMFTLDMTVPVYLKQTGHYYLIRKLSVKGGAECDVELIKI